MGDGLRPTRLSSQGVTEQGPSPGMEPLLKGFVSPLKNQNGSAKDVVISTKERCGMLRSHSYPSGKAKEKEEYSKSKRYNSFPSPSSSSSSSFLGQVSSPERLFGQGGFACQWKTVSGERDEAMHQTPLRVILPSKEGGVYTIEGKEMVVVEDFFRTLSSRKERGKFGRGPGGGIMGKKLPSKI